MNANIHRGVHLLSEGGHRTLRSRPEPDRRFHRCCRTRGGRLHGRGHGVAQHGRLCLGRTLRAGGRQHRGQRDGAPLEHRAVAVAGPAQREPRYACCPSTTTAVCGRSVCRRSWTPARGRSPSRRRPIRSVRGPTCGPWSRRRTLSVRWSRSMAVRVSCTAGRMSGRWGATSTPSRATKALRSDGNRRAVRPPGAARGDAALSGRRRHGRSRDLRGDDLRPRAAQVRGRHGQLRGGHRAGARRGVPAGIRSGGDRGARNGAAAPRHGTPLGHRRAPDLRDDRRQVRDRLVQRRGGCIPTIWA